MASTAPSTKGGKNVSEAPPPPPGISYPENFRFRRCRRCGHWNSSPAPYDLTHSQECRWQKVLPWEQGSLYNPQGAHCLLCRKARGRGFTNHRIETTITTIQTTVLRHTGRTLYYRHFLKKIYIYKHMWLRKWCLYHAVHVPVPRTRATYPYPVPCTTYHVPCTMYHVPNPRCT